jgi:hypothetical protein
MQPSSVGRIPRQRDLSWTEDGYWRQDGVGTIVRGMRSLLLSVMVTVVALGSGPTATFSVDGTAITSSTSLATIQPRTGAPGYSWLRIHFYSEPLTSGDLLSGAQGRIESMKAKWSAVLQLTLDQDSNVW